MDKNELKEFLKVLGTETKQTKQLNRQYWQECNRAKHIVCKQLKALYMSLDLMQMCREDILYSQIFSTHHNGEVVTVPHSVRQEYLERFKKEYETVYNSLKTVNIGPKYEYKCLTDKKLYYFDRKVLATCLHILYNKMRKTKKQHTKDDNEYIQKNSGAWKAVLERMEVSESLLAQQKEGCANA